MAIAGSRPRGPAADCSAGGPAPKVETQMTESGPDCATKAVTVTTVTTTTRYVFDSRSGRWLPGEPEKTTSTSTRPLTLQQAAACAPTTEPHHPSRHHAADQAERADSADQAG